LKQIVALVVAAALILVSSQAFARDRDDVPDREQLDVPRVLLINSLLPGTAQIAMGRRGEGIAIMATSLSLRIAGITMMLIDARNSVSAQGGLGFYREDGRTYLLPPDDSGLLAETWLGNTGMLLALHGALLGAYSAHDAYLELVVPGRPGAMPLAEALAAPYRPANVLNWSVLPVLGFLTFASLSYDDILALGEFFRADRVDFWGAAVPPLAGLALNTAFSLAFVHANAAAEEYLYRGVQLGATGVARSSISFGMAHLPNMLMPGVSIEDTLIQTAFAGLFGWYVGQMTVNSNFDLGKAIALHFWNNVIAFTLGYLTEQAGAEPGFSWSVDIAY